MTYFAGGGETQHQRGWGEEEVGGGVRAEENGGRALSLKMVDGMAAKADAKAEDVSLERPF